MWQNKYLFFFLLCVWASKTQAQTTTNRANYYLLGPLAGVGLSWGSRGDLKDKMYLKLPGASTQFGLSFYKYLKTENAIGVSLLYQQNKWAFSTKQETVNLQPDTKYSVNEKSIVLPIEFNHLFTPYVARMFFGLGVVPAYSVGKTLQRMKDNAGDTTTAVIYPELKSYPRFAMGFTAKIGTDLDFDFKYTGRLFLEFKGQYYGAKEKKASHTYGVFLVAQFFFSEL